MIRLLAPGSVALLLVALGAAVGWSADRQPWSAWLLHLEPLLWVFGAWAAAIAVFARRWMWAIALIGGGVTAVAVARLPRDVSSATREPPDWTRPVGRCMTALKPPEGRVRILTWTLDAGVGVAPVMDVVRAARPDVAVLHDVADPAIVAAVLEFVGGEAQFHSSPLRKGGIAVIAAGGFHPCGDAVEWEDLDAGSGASLAFVGVPPATIFPLLVTRLPGPLDGAGWVDALPEARGKLADLVGGLETLSLVLVADAQAPRNSKLLDGRMAALGLSTVPVPPSWPARIGSVPLVTLHPYDRAWVGDHWRMEAARRVAATVGTRAPILTVLAPRPSRAGESLDPESKEPGPAGATSPVNKPGGPPPPPA